MWSDADRAKVRDLVMGIAEKVGPEPLVALGEEIEQANAACCGCGWAADLADILVNQSG